MSGSLPHDMAHDATSADAAVEALQGNKPTQLPLSKNAQKKLVKAERMLALKAERRTREKAAKKEKRKERAQKRAAGEEVDKVPSRKRARLDGPSRPFEARVVVDLSFDDKMIDKVRRGNNCISVLGQQMNTTDPGDRKLPRCARNSLIRTARIAKQRSLSPHCCLPHSMVGLSRG